MRVLNWSDAFSTGHRVLDEQHRAILHTFNALIASLDTAEHATANIICHQLEREVADHCQFEEQLLAEVEFPGLDAHKHTHTEIAQATTAIRTACGGDCSRAAAVNCQKRLTEEVVKQVLVADLDFKSHLQEHGR